MPHAQFVDAIATGRAAQWGALKGEPRQRTRYPEGWGCRHAPRSGEAREIHLATVPKLSSKTDLARANTIIMSSNERIGKVSDQRNHQRVFRYLAPPFHRRKMP
jgi:hypothetical protein